MIWNGSSYHIPTLRNSCQGNYGWNYSYWLISFELNDIQEPCEILSIFLDLGSSSTPAIMTTADITTPSEYPNSSPTSSLLSSAPSFPQKTLLNGAKIGIVTSMVFGVILAVPIGLILSRRRKISRLRRANIPVPLEYSKPKNTADAVRMK